MKDGYKKFYEMDLWIETGVLYIVRGEIEEIQSHLIVAGSRAYLDKEVSKNLIHKYEEVKKKLNRYISTLYNQMKTNDLKPDKRTD
jgi:four helix bundle protein